MQPPDLLDYSENLYGQTLWVLVTDDISLKEFE